MRIKIDPELCTGCEDCTEACPALFRLGKDWIAVPAVDPVPEGMEVEARRVADLCQFEAISVET